MIFKTDDIFSVPESDDTKIIRGIDILIAVFACLCIRDTEPTGINLNVKVMMVEVESGMSVDIQMSVDFRCRKKNGRRNFIRTGIDDRDILRVRQKNRLFFSGFPIRIIRHKIHTELPYLTALSFESRVILRSDLDDIFVLFGVDSQRP